METGALTGILQIDVQQRPPSGAAFVFWHRCFGLTVEPRGPIGTPMITASTSIIARRRRIIAVWAVVCV
jgi:hypothetical protein